LFQARCTPSSAATGRRPATAFRASNRAAAEQVIIERIVAFLDEVG
jgi:hypothetical protein